VISITHQRDGTHSSHEIGPKILLALLLLAPGQSFLMVAIRNLYWTEGIRTFIVCGLILASTLCGVAGAAPGGVTPEIPSVREIRARLVHRST
jgi:hypothetical protein